MTLHNFKRAHLWGFFNGLCITKNKALVMKKATGELKICGFHYPKITKNLDH